MKIKTSIIFLLLVLSLARPAHSGGIDQARSLFYQGNSHYSEEKFKDAISDYEKALLLGFESGPLYYNLGNAYFKSGILGKAVLNYLRAERLMPQDADLKSNLHYVRSLIKNNINPKRKRWLLRVFFSSTRLFSLKKITLITASLYYVMTFFILIAIVARRTRRLLRYIILLFAILLIVSISVFSAQFYNSLIRHEAVIEAKSTEAKFEPFASATTFFTLKEGSCVTVLVPKGDWVKIRRIDGKQGWVKKTDIEFL